MKDRFRNCLKYTALLVTFICSRGFSYSATVEVFQNTKPVLVQVELPELKKAALESDLVKFINPPTDLHPDRNGCFCYDISDARLVFTTSYYNAVQQLLSYNRILEKIGYAKLKGLQITLIKMNDPGEGSANMDGFELHYSTAAIDPGTEAHEIGHWIHYHLRGSRDFPFNPGTPFSFRAYAEKSGITEGTANILAAWFTGNPQINKSTFPEFPYDVNTFVRFPDVFISTMDTIVELNAIPRVSQQFPDYSKMINSLIDKAKLDPNLSDYLAQPDPYFSSAIINQPLWLASQKFDHDNLKIIYLKAISQLKSGSAYSDLAKEILKAAKDFPEIEKYLRQSFSLRGIALN